jgi:hypothetical protein
MFDGSERSADYFLCSQGNRACLGQNILEDILRSHLVKQEVSVEPGRALVAIELDSDSVTATVCIQKDGKPL